MIWPDLHTWDALPVFAELFWKSGALLAAALGASAFLRNRSADLRRLVLSASMVIMILAAALTPAMPPRAATLPSWLMLPASASQAPSAPSFGPKFDNWAESLPQQGRPRVPETPFRHSRLGLRGWLMHRLPVIPIVWFVGAAILLARFLVGLHRLRRLRIDSYALNDVGLLGRLGHSRISLLENESIGSPVTWGILRPVILVPIRFHELPINDRLQVFCHELGHIQGNDFVLRVLVEVVCALIWFQPLVWIARRQLREEQELACDNRASVASGRTILKALSLSDNKLTARR
jgi:beta-lactamase regulating signal transducer with metallopeptidase domain